MAIAAVEVALDPATSAQLLGWTLAGAALGSISGLIPGLHANNFALLLAGLAPAVPGPPLFVGMAMLAAGVVHTFLNAVPAMALGVPEADMVVTALPGHTMVLEGRGYEALRLSAVGSILAVLLAVPLAGPITMGVLAIYPTLRAHLSIVLALISLALVLSESTWRGRVGAGTSFLLASALGHLTLDIVPNAPLDGGGMLTPIFAGLFGAPVLIDAMQGGGVPPQEGPALRMTRGSLVLTSLAGAIAGAIVGYMPGVSAAIAAVAVLVLVPGDAGDRGYIVATSGVDTSNMIFGLVALVAIGQPRSGVMVAFESIKAPLDLPVLMSAVLIAGLIGFGLVIVLGDYYLLLVGRTSYWKISVSVLVLLVVLVLAFTGVLGLVVFLVSTLLGMLPVRLGTRRVHLMGVLMGPIMLM